MCIKSCHGPCSEVNGYLGHTQGMNVIDGPETSVVLIVRNDSLGT